MRISGHLLTNCQGISLPSPPKPSGVCQDHAHQPAIIIHSPQRPHSPYCCRPDLRHRQLRRYIHPRVSRGESRWPKPGIDGVIGLARFHRRWADGTVPELALSRADHNGLIDARCRLSCHCTYGGALSRPSLPLSLSIGKRTKIRPSAGSPVLRQVSFT